jgi:hypothetical protein
MHGPINFKFPNNNSKWQMGFNSAFKGLMYTLFKLNIRVAVKKYSISGFRRKEDQGKPAVYGSKWLISSVGTALSFFI